MRNNCETKDLTDFSVSMDVKRERHRPSSSVVLIQHKTNFI